MKLGIATLVISAGLGSGFLSQRYTQEQADKTVASYYALDNLTSIIAAQEQELGIHYTSVPTVILGLPDGTTDTLLGGNSEEILGSYVPDKNTIYLNSGATFVTMDSTLTNYAALFFGFWQQPKIEQVFHHELGHVYIYQRELALGVDLHQAYSHSETLMDMIAIRSTLEGIAEYVSMRMTGTPRIRNPAYGLGFKVVQPILDVSVSVGIDYILTHMPSGNDLDITHRTAYQRKAIEEINQAK